MKKFILYVLSGVATILIVMLVLDIAYTKIYESALPRSKFQYFRSLKNKKIDYIFIGSSRVENGIIPAIIEKKTGKLAINLGFQAAKLGDIYTILQLVNAYNIKFQTILIQVDYIYNIKGGHSNIFAYEMTPFLRENSIITNYSDRYAKNPIANYYVPFYRYCNNDLKIGFREIFANIVRKKTNMVLQKGYVPRFGNAAALAGAFPADLVDKNKTLEHIQSFIQQNKMNVVFYCAPVCLNTKNIDYILKLKSKIPELKDFSKAINQDDLFLDCNHLNDKGARKFTEIITEQILITKQK